MTTTEDVCCICFEKFTSERILVDEELLDLLKFLVENINACVLQNRQICEPCLEKVQEACNFKILYQENSHKKCTDSDTNIVFGLCHICKDSIENVSFASFFDFTKESNELTSYLIEGLDEETYANLHICMSCKKSILNLLPFMTTLSTFDNKKMYNIKVECLESEIDIKQEPPTEDNYPVFTPSVINDTSIDIKIEQLTTNETNKENEECSAYEDSLCESKQLNLKIECDESSLSKKESGSSPVEHIVKKTKLSNDKLPLKSKHVFQCPYCDLQSKCRNYLRRHVINKHLIDERASKVQMYQCPSCSFTTKHKYWLKTHKLIHELPENLDLFKCFHCEFQTKYRISIKLHVKLHRNPKYKCDYCSFKAHTRKSLRQHHDSHLNDAIIFYGCKICGYETITKSSLKNKHLKLVHKIKINDEWTKYMFKRKQTMEGKSKSHKT